MKLPIIEIQKLSYRYPTSGGWTLNDISFTVNRGEIFGIVGPTGAGKTTLGMCIRGLIPHNIGGTISGKVLLNGTSTLELNPGELADEIGIVFQNAESQAIGLTVLEDLAFGPENMNLAPEIIQERINRVAEDMDLMSLLDRESYALSGGQKQRLAIGGVLVMEPKALVLDEPTAELDPIGKVEIFETIKTLRKERNYTIVVIEHEVEALAEIADRILVLNHGIVEALGKPDEIFRRIGLFREVKEKTPFVAELLADLIERGHMREDQFTSKENEAVKLLQKCLSIRGQS
jgi:energy-coupling factor transporter ATP-binding protein EcfA2